MELPRTIMTKRMLKQLKSNSSQENVLYTQMTPEMIFHKMTMKLISKQLTGTNAITKNKKCAHASSELVLS